ncbi:MULTISPECIES: hypothetical protein [unclassified Brevundimonas]|uniref:hypothetical protein n=1 Tax=unclassified Brevundimonas TaxID=2622653 RepID=UPI0025C5D761|nr:MULTISPECIES: hypothetical protein [unclassified Brevundimonas]
MMLRHVSPTPPKDPGHWTLLQQRPDRALWQWERRSNGGSPLTRYVITHDPSRLEFDDFDEAETMFERLQD